jgi:hypothetical protein
MALFVFPPTTIDTTGLATDANQVLQLANEATMIANQATSLANEATLLANDVTSLANEATIIADLQELVDLTQMTVVDQLDTPVLITSSTNIPGSASAPLEVIASTAANIQKLQSVEDIGEYIGVYTGAASSEVLKCILPLGGGEVQLEIPAGTRISLRSMTVSAISIGSLALNCLG